MRDKSLFLITPIGILILLVVFGMATYNTLVEKNEQVHQSEAKVLVTLQRRADLIPTVVSAMKSYIPDEEDIFTSIENARDEIGSSDKSTRTKGHELMSSAIVRLLRAKDNYPELKSHPNVLTLIDELDNIENQLRLTRKDYNKMANSYNSVIKRFPMKIIADMSGFKTAEIIPMDD